MNWLGLGIENPNQVLRQEIHKDHFVDVKITDLMKSMKDAGINIGGNYIFGLPMDTQESMQNTLDFAIANKTEMVNFYCAMAYPEAHYIKQPEKKVGNCLKHILAIVNTLTICSTFLMIIYVLKKLWLFEMKHLLNIIQTIIIYNF